MIIRSTFAILGSVAAMGVLWAQNPPPTISKAPLKASSPASGQEMFMQYCAVCHGKDGRGRGPAAAALKKAPTDLTTLAARNNGTFPESRVYQYIQGDTEVTAHGSREMPIWGALFRDLNRDATVEQMRIGNLTSYLSSIQTRYQAK